MSKKQQSGITRRQFVEMVGAAAAACGAARAMAASPATPAQPPKDASGKVIPGFEQSKTKPDAAKGWQPFSDRKIRVGIAGYGLCQFGAAWGFQNHPNVEVVAVTDLIPERCAGLAKACRCEKTYPSCEEMIKDDRIEAVFIATDAPSHARLAVAALERGKHVASAVPAVFGSLEDAGRLFEAVKKSGLKYMMFETSCGHADLWAMRQRYEAGELGKIIFSEGEYYHYFGSPLGGYNPKTKNVDTNGWRKGLPPQWYPTHSNAYYVGVTGGSFTEVLCMGMPSIVPHLRADSNDYKNPFGSEIALFRTSEGGMSRMAVCWDLPAAGGERGRAYGQKNGKGAVNTARPPLPPGLNEGTHGGGNYLMCDFVDAILRNRKPRVDVAQALNMTVAGIVAHQSALKGGELMKIPQYAL
ncbi:MAG: oxidoreductase [Planctomycetes bacterium SM23_25]|nr:MAG: oxidoreductase [Planctomycetes bacterium SM23_25]